MNSEIFSGILTGILSAIIFNPIDKAIYISTTKNLAITNKEIWKNPYKGSLNTISTRIITSGLYFTYLDYYSSVSTNKCNISLMTSLS